MAEETTEQSSSQGGGKGLIIVLIVLVLILVLAIAGGGYFLYSQGIFSPKDETTQSVNNRKPEQRETFKAEINDLVLNITNARGKEKLMKLSFAIKSTEPTIVNVVEANKAEIIDVVIAQISARSSEELLTVGGKNLLKEEFVQDINEVLNKYASSNEDLQLDSVKQILFTTFVIK